MGKDRTVTVGFSREDAEGVEQIYEVRCRVYLGTADTWHEPGDPAEVEILTISPVDGAPPLDEGDLSAGEMETIMDVAVDEASTPGLYSEDP